MSHEVVEPLQSQMLADKPATGERDEIRAIRQSPKRGKFVIERQKIEEALWRSEAQFSNLARAAPVGIFRTDVAGHCLYVNERWSEIAGITSTDALGEGWVRAIHPDDIDFVFSTWQAAAEAHQPFMHEYRFRRSDGVVTWVYGQAVAEKEMSGKVIGFVGTITDITSRKQMEDKILQLNADLEKQVDERTADLRTANESLRNEMGERLRLEQEVLNIAERERRHIGHDLHDEVGQRLVGVWFLSQALQHKLEVLSIEEAADAAKITEVMSVALSLTRRLARGLHPVGLDAGGLVAAFKDLAIQTNDMFDLQCRVQSNRSEINMHHTSATHIYRVGQEAVTNAVKHSGAKHIDINLAVHADTLTLTISDDGCGLPVEVIQKETMGLRIMRYRADCIGGEFSIQRQPDRGTIVTVRLPLGESSDASS